MSQSKLFAVVVVAVLLGVVSLTHAEKTQVRARTQAVSSADEVVRAAWVAKWEVELEENATAWDAWREDFAAVLEVDEDYATAVVAVESYDKGVFFDEEEFAGLVAARDDVHRRLAGRVYEDHFGAWEGDLAEFDVVVALASPSPVDICVNAAIKACGGGKVKSVKVTGDSCEFTCFPAAQ